ncbi:MAG: hypothetical protein OXU88_01080, partial [Gammaproteobacteria bacterium]|nr:hypothetical protein [Gammaproteobacteria bacterium]
MGTVTPDWAWREAPPRLPAGAVHLWAAETTPLCAQSNLLTVAELTRAHRIADPAQRAMTLGGRAGLRHLLCAYSGLDNAA